MKIKVHWIIDGVAELDVKNAEEAEKKVEQMLSVYLTDDNDLTKKLGAKAIQGTALLPGSDEIEKEIKDN